MQQQFKCVINNDEKYTYQSAIVALCCDNNDYDNQSSQLSVAIMGTREQSSAMTITGGADNEPS
eukprot:9444057-Ditylum_brightwellii.AAC.2